MNWIKFIRNSSKSIFNQGTKYTRSSWEYTQKHTSKSLNHAKHKAGESLKYAKEQVNLRHRTIALIKYGGNWFRTTRLYRYTKLGIIFGTLGKISYVYGTNFRKDITISKSFHRYTSRGSNDYLLADENHDLYKVSESLWFWQWWPTEMWSGMNEGETYEIVGYGIRNRKFGIYPNIVASTKVNHDEKELRKLNVTKDTMSK